MIWVFEGHVIHSEVLCFGILKCFRNGSADVRDVWRCRSGMMAFRIVAERSVCNDHYSVMCSCCPAIVSSMCFVGIQPFQLLL